MRALQTPAVLQVSCPRVTPWMQVVFCSLGRKTQIQVLQAALSDRADGAPPPLQIC